MYSGKLFQLGAGKALDVPKQNVFDSNAALYSDLVKSWTNEHIQLRVRNWRPKPVIPNAARI